MAGSENTLPLQFCHDKSWHKETKDRYGCEDIVRGVDQVLEDTKQGHDSVNQSSIKSI